VWVGNPHAVVFCPDPETVDLARLGARLECHPGLRERSNVEFAAECGMDRLNVRVWERGSGITLACGTGACAVFAAARRERRCGAEAEVRLPGGSLYLAMQGEHIRMTGPACTVFEGEIFP
jgi:diaminopimelate epimerase